MSTQTAIRCLVDDTALTRNITEIESWVSQGNITLVVPLYTIGRLHVLKKDSSQIGVNARKAVKFLDRSTSSRGDLPHDPVILQGPDEEYTTWAEVEEHYLNEDLKPARPNGENPAVPALYKKQEKDSEGTMKASVGAGGALSQMLLDKLNFARDLPASSPTSTPPLSPASSGPQSSKTSPEVKSATMLNHDQIPVPPSLKPLLNPVVWYVNQRGMSAGEKVIFLTNSADTMHLARDFGIPTKNIHQLRSALGIKEDEVKGEESTKETKKSPRVEQKTLFSYEEAESEEEELVFKPRGRGSTRAGQSARGGAGHGRGKSGPARSPRTSFSTPAQPTPAKPQIPVEEIDPDSFDRGGFGRGSTPLVNTSTQVPAQFNPTRGSGYRGTYGQGSGRGANTTRGHGRGFERGSARGRGRLFVP